MKDFNEGVEELLKLLDTNMQVWLMGAGVSFDANIPLMYPLTQRVSSMMTAPNDGYLRKILGVLKDNSHIEHVLSHIGDLIAIASRSKSGNANIDGDDVSVDVLNGLHAEIIKSIAITVRYGYKPASGTVAEEIGNIEKPIVDIKRHMDFIEALFEGRKNLESRSRVIFATTNYDTLIEDALSLSGREIYDGFSSGGIGFWRGHVQGELGKLLPRNHQLIKLHGSVDWLRASNGGLVRARYGASYLASLEDTLIYPQATKYVETQKDPFASLFSAFRGALSSQVSHALCIVGYSFGDEHINLEIEDSIIRDESKTNIVAFVRESTALPACLEKWRVGPLGSRIYIATEKALYAGGRRFENPSTKDLLWWTFSGLTDFLKTGVAK